LARKAEDRERGKRRVSKQLPKSFVSENAGQPLIYPPGWKETFNLFAEIAEKDGLNEAHRIFAEVQKRARRAAVKLPNSKPQQIKHGSHNPARDLEWLGLYNQAIGQGMSKAAAIKHVYKTASHKPHSEAALDRHLRRLHPPDK
jgi:hypothetical protein